MNMTNNNVRALIAAAASIAASCTAAAQTVLIDFGNDDSFRGVSVTSPTPAGTFWNSVDASVFWENLTDINGEVTDVDFGFTFVTGTDSFNGPAGATSEATLAADFATFEAGFAPGVLGDIGAAGAAFDFYVDPFFQIQGLDPAKTYDLTFYGAHKFNADNTTRYAIYSDEFFFSEVPGKNAELVVGEGPNHNTSNTVTISNVAPIEVVDFDSGDSNWIIFVGALASDSFSGGYLNALQLREVPTIDITAQPSDALVDEGELLSFSASVRGEAGLTGVTYDVGLVTIDDLGNVSGVAGAVVDVAPDASGDATFTITLPPVTLADASSYRLDIRQFVNGVETAVAVTNVVVGGVRPDADLDFNESGEVDFFDQILLIESIF